MDIILGIILTAFMYMICPFLIFVGNKREFTKKQIRNVILINSIFICIIDNLIALLLIENYNSASIWPAFVYFSINYAIWIKKGNNNKSEKIKPKKAVSGEITNERLEKLEKLKDLLDKEAITKEEFEKEKKKILQ